MSKYVFFQPVLRGQVRLMELHKSFANELYHDVHMQPLQDTNYLGLLSEAQWIWFG